MHDRGSSLGNLLAKMRLAASISWWALQPIREWSQPAERGRR